MKLKPHPRGKNIPGVNWECNECNCRVVIEASATFGSPTVHCDCAAYLISGYAALKQTEDEHGVEILRHKDFDRKAGLGRHGY